ncbi:MAG: FHA domain-containing protein [Bacteroidaceae bacterium]
MKRVPCPKCQNLIPFDETKYTEGQSLVFICEQCKKQFSIRLGTTQLRNRQQDENYLSTEEGYIHQLGCIIVVENVFGFKQVLPLKLGDNLIGRKCIGSEVTTAIESSDMSMDRKHCFINVSRNKKGKLTYTLRDFPSLTGTFVQHDILNDRDRRTLHDGDVITIGATSLIFRTAIAKE